MRAMWTGAVTFGLVSVPVKVYAATEEQDVKFHQVHRDDGGRVKYLRECQAGNHEVEFRDIAKGYTTADGRQLILEPEDLDALQTPATKSINVEEFVPADQIDPLLINKAYYVGPDKGNAVGYALLRKVLEETDRMAIVKVALRSRERLAVLRVLRHCLVLQTMLWPDEVRSTDEISGLAQVIEVDEHPMLDQARTLIGAMANDFDPDRYTDNYTVAVRALIEKLETEAPRVHHGASYPPHVPATSADEALMAALTGSLAASKKEN